MRYLVLVDRGEGVQILVSVPKKLHKRAVRRNLLKRRLREAFRAGTLSVPEGMRVRLGLIYVSKEAADYHTIGDAVNVILARVEDRLREIKIENV